MFKLTNPGLLALAFTISLTLAEGGKAAPIMVGSGPDSVRLIIEDAAFGGILDYQYNYTHNPGSPISGQDLLTEIILADPNLDGVGHTEGFLSSLSYTLAGGSTATLTNDFATENVSWFQWSAGGLIDDDYDGGVLTPPVPISSGSWTLGPGMGFRFLEPNSAEGWTFGAYDADFNPLVGPPSVLPTPEPSPLLLLGIALGTLFGIRRMKQ